MGHIIHGIGLKYEDFNLYYSTMEKHVATESLTAS